MYIKNNVNNFIKSDFCGLFKINELIDLLQILTYSPFVDENISKIANAFLKELRIFDSKFACWNNEKYPDPIDQYIYFEKNINEVIKTFENTEKLIKYARDTILIYAWTFWIYLLKNNAKFLIKSANIHRFNSKKNIEIIEKTII